MCVRVLIVMHLKPRIRLRECLLLFLAPVIFCSMISCSTTGATTNEAKIVSSLASTNRNEVYVALWTLEKSGHVVPKHIDFKAPYENNRKHLERLAGGLKKLGPARLMELDNTLEYHRSIYSPMWSPISANWE